jgi:hypothetical protein
VIFTSGSPRLPWQSCANRPLKEMDETDKITTNTIRRKKVTAISLLNS